jgi:hypothetical protein
VAPHPHGFFALKNLQQMPLFFGYSFDLIPLKNNKILYKIIDNNLKICSSWNPSKKAKPSCAFHTIGGASWLAEAE